MRENQLSARKTTPTRLTFGLQRTKNNASITCRTYFNARAIHTWYERYFLFAVYRKLALSVSFGARKVDFPALVRWNIKCARKTIPTCLTFGILRTKNIVYILRTESWKLTILPHQCGKINFPHAKLYRLS